MTYTEKGPRSVLLRGPLLYVRKPGTNIDP